MYYISFNNLFSFLKEPTIEAQQEKLHFQLARIHEVNGHLRALMEASDKGFPMHMNLAISRDQPLSNLNSNSNSGTIKKLSRVDKNGYINDCPPEAINQLKEQNHKLTEEVSSKSERISTLEREKTALLQELFQSRATQHMQLYSGAPSDSTFM